MRTRPPTVMAAVMLTLAGCSVGPAPSIERNEAAAPLLAIRHLEIEVGDLQSGLPCAVIDRPDAVTRKLLWRAEYDGGFCRRKADETRQRLQDRGWACRFLGTNERQGLVQASTSGSLERPHLAAVWSCIRGAEPGRQQIAIRPPVPSAKPERPLERPPSIGDDRLRASVEADLATIGQDAIDLDTAVDTALGDLNGDGTEDAIVVLTRKTDQGAPHRMLMAYLQSRDTFSLVDVLILDVPKQDDGRAMAIAIADGRINLENCCEGGRDPTILVLDERRLTYERGG